MFFRKQKQKRLTPDELRSIVNEKAAANFKQLITEKLAFDIIKKVFSGKFEVNDDKTVSVYLLNGIALYDSKVDRILFDKILKEHNLEIRDYNMAFFFGRYYKVKVL